MKKNLMVTMIPMLLFALNIQQPCFAGQESYMSEVTGNEIAGGGVFNVATFDSPVAIRLADTGLKEAGLAAGDVVPKSDEIRIFSSREAMNAAPLARIWLNQREGGAYWFITGGDGDASEFIIPEGAAVVIWTKASIKPVSWTNVFR